MCVSECSVKEVAIFYPAVARAFFGKFFTIPFFYALVIFLFLFHGTKFELSRDLRTETSEIRIK